MKDDLKTRMDRTLLAIGLSTATLILAISLLIQNATETAAVILLH